MKTVIIGSKGVGKTRFVVSLLPRSKGKTIFFSELPEVGLKSFARNLNVDINCEIDTFRPSELSLEAAETNYDNIIIDHWLRIKDISSRKIRSKFFDLLEHSNKNWIILAHTLKGKQPEDIDDGRWTSGLDAVVDVGLGAFRLSDGVIFKILKDRYYIFKGARFLDENTIKKVLF